MYCNIINDILNSMQTIELFEDLINCRSDSDFEDESYKYFDGSYFNINETVIDYPQPDGPSTSPLPKCFKRLPNNSFLNNNPYIYYEPEQSPTDEEYLYAIYTIKNIDELITNSEDQFIINLRNLSFHNYVIYKSVNIDYRIPNQEWKNIKKFYNEMLNIYTKIQNEELRIDDQSWFSDIW